MTLKSWILRPEGVTEIGKESARRNQSKKEKSVWWQNGRVKLFRRLFRVSIQAPCVVQAKCGRDKGDCGDEENSVDVRHIVHDRLLQVADVVLRLVS